MVFRNWNEGGMFFHWHPQAECVAFVFHRPSGQQGGVDWNLLTEVGQTVRLLTHGFNAQPQVDMTVPRQRCKPSAEYIVAKQMRTGLAESPGDPHQLSLDGCSPFINVPTLFVKRLEFLFNGRPHSFHHGTVVGCSVGSSV